MQSRPGHYNPRPSRMKSILFKIFGIPVYAFGAAICIAFMQSFWLTRRLIAADRRDPPFKAGATEEEKKAFLEDLGLEEPGLHRLVRAAYALLDLITFLTAGPKEVKAWTIRRGTLAPQAAGTIHTDFERTFIRAEVIAFDDYVACGGEAGAKAKGLMRVEGKDYVMRDGDVVHFRVGA